MCCGQVTVRCVEYNSQSHYSLSRMSGHPFHIPDSYITLPMGSLSCNIHISCPGFHFLILSGYCEWEANTFQAVSSNTFIVGLLFTFIVLLSTFYCYTLTHNTHTRTGLLYPLGIL